MSASLHDEHNPSTSNEAESPLNVIVQFLQPTNLHPPNRIPQDALSKNMSKKTRQPGGIDNISK